MTGSYGGAALEWGRRRLGLEPRPWQTWALDRALEHRADGSLRWPVVVLTVSRQSGKSVIGRVACGWRLEDGPAAFGETQTVLSTAHKFAAAVELWTPAAFALAGHDHARITWAHGQESIRLGDTGSRWLVQAASPNLAFSLSVSLGLVDEAWSVDRAPVESGLVPTMLERESPQLWIVSTAGDSSSDLLEAYRTAGVAGLEAPADTLLLEWSADPTAPVDDRAAWRAASPHWTPRREAYIERQLQTLPEGTFRTQLLNQRVDALGGWITRSQWAACESPALEILEGDAAPRVIAAIEHSEDATRYVLVATQRQGERIATIAHSVRTLDDLWRLVVALPRSALLLVSVGFKNRLPLAPCETRPVGVNEVRSATRIAHRAITDRVIAHAGDAEMAAQLLTAVVAYTGESGPVLSQRRSPGPITIARALVWCIGAQYEVGQTRPAPRVVSA